MPAPRPEEALPSLLPGPADALCLDFANTRYWRGSPSPTEDLAGPDGLLAWCESAGGAGDAAALARARWAAARAAEAGAGLGAGRAAPRPSARSAMRNPARARGGFVGMKVIVGRAVPRD